MIIEKLTVGPIMANCYILGCERTREAAVIDPRRDCEIYVELASGHGCRITHVFETHRNEDLVSGAAILARQTGAPVHHGPNPAGPVQYAETAREGDEFSLGQIRLRVLETPGHTDDSLSFVLFDGDTSTDDAVAVFTGDALFVGDVGRTDFYPDRAREVAGLLFDSLRKILAVGDQAVRRGLRGKPLQDLKPRVDDRIGIVVDPRGPDIGLAALPVQSFDLVRRCLDHVDRPLVDRLGGRVEVDLSDDLSAVPVLVHDDEIALRDRSQRDRIGRVGIRYPMPALPFPVQYTLVAQVLE